MEGAPSGLMDKEAFGSDPRAAKWMGLLGRLRREWKHHKLGDAAAALTFYGVLSLFPFLLFIVALAGLVIQPEQVQALMGELGREVPQSLSRIPAAQLTELTSRPSRGVLTFGALAAVWSATKGVVNLMKALNTAYGVTERRPRWKIYGIALGMMLAGAVLALLMMIFWGTLYFVLPDARQKLKFILPGSVVGVLVWLAASLGFSFYVSHFSTFGITYGALGGIIILLLWMWISSLALMLGAELNAVLARPRSSPHRWRPRVRQIRAGSGLG